jgi:hypothetical protein
MHQVATRVKGIMLCSIVMYALTGYWSGDASGQFSRPATSSVTLQGQSSGGTLTLMKAPGLNYPYIIVTNQPGDTAAASLRRLALRLKECSKCVEYFGDNPVAEGDSTLVLQGGFSNGRCSAWIFGGSEHGFSIPLPPLAVSAWCNADRVKLNWTNPLDGYDTIALVYQGIPWTTLPGTATEYVHDVSSGPDPFGVGDDVIFVVLGCKAGTPSNGAGVRLRKKAQLESLMNVPFTQGVAPNFQVWTYQTPPGGMTFEQGELPGMEQQVDVRNFQGNGFCQVIKGNATFCGGVFRRFLGLMPGHTYQTSVRMNTLKTKKEGDWGFSFHAAYNATNGENLTAEQMAGTVALPNGSRGLEAGEICRYGPTTGTDGAWVLQTSGKSKRGETSTDVTLPSGVTSITIWLRFRGVDLGTGAVGFDALKLEDLGITR